MVHSCYSFIHSILVISETVSERCSSFLFLLNRSSVVFQDACGNLNVQAHFGISFHFWCLMHDPSIFKRWRFKYPNSFLHEVVEVCPKAFHMYSSCSLSYCYRFELHWVHISNTLQLKRFRSPSFFQFLILNSSSSSPMNSLKRYEGRSWAARGFKKLV